MTPGGVSKRRKMDKHVTVLPEPDSPTIPRVVPRVTSKETPFTARTTPVSVRKEVTRLRTDSTKGKALPRFLPRSPQVHVEAGPGAARNAGRVARSERCVRRRCKRKSLVGAAAERPSLHDGRDIDAQGLGRPDPGVRTPFESRQARQPAPRRLRCRPRLENARHRDEDGP